MINKMYYLFFIELLYIFAKLNLSIEAFLFENYFKSIDYFESSLIDLRELILMETTFSIFLLFSID